MSHEATSLVWFSVVDGIAWYAFFLKYLLAVVATIIAVSSFDDLLVDIAYWLYRLEDRLIFWQRRDRVRDRDLHRCMQRPLAIIVPAWQESPVIARMLLNTLKTIDYGPVHVFVGTYPNDPDTQREVDRIRARHPNVHRVNVPHDGPTSKADCLNWTMQSIFLFEQEHGIAFSGFVLHDSEDVIHANELKLFNVWLDRRDMIQIPVLSLPRKWTALVACHYMDEFAEWHTKDLVVREQISGSVPSAGVGTAFSRRAMRALCEGRDNQPFNTDSLTEDYDVAIRIGELGMRHAFVRHFTRVPGTRRTIFGRVRKTRERELISVREFFPDSFRASYRQKARWMLGISFFGWRDLGWFGRLGTRYFLYRDRKALLTAPVAVLAYLIFLSVALYYAFVWTVPGSPRFPTLVEEGSYVWYLLIVNFMFLLNRVAHRAWLVGSTHGWQYAVLSPVRIVVANVVSFCSFARATRIFWRSTRKNERVTWDKTTHSYPSITELRAQRQRLGDILAHLTGVETATIDKAVADQARRYRPLGLLLLDRGEIDDLSLANALGEQSGMGSLSFDPIADLDEDVWRRAGKSVWERFSALPVNHGKTRIAVASPLTPHERSELEAAAGLDKPVYFVAPLSDIAWGLRHRHDAAAFDSVTRDVATLKRIGLLDAVRESRLWRDIRESYVRLGDLLVRQGSIDHPALEVATARFFERQGGGRLGEFLVSEGLIRRDDLDRALAMQAKLKARVLALATRLGIVVSPDAARAQQWQTEPA